MSWRDVLRDDASPLAEGDVLRLCYGLLGEKERLDRFGRPGRGKHYDDQSGPWLSEVTGIEMPLIYRARNYMLSFPSGGNRISWTAERHGFCLRAVRPRMFTVDQVPARVVDGELWEREEAARPAPRMLMGRQVADEH